MPHLITSLLCDDVRFPTSLEGDGSDAMHRNPDYSCAYVSISTDAGYTGYGLAFTLGRGTEVVVTAIGLLKRLVVGKDLDLIFDDFAGYWRELVCEDQMRWLGPEKGVMHMAVAAIVNCLWDIWAKMEGKPLWKLLVDMEPEKLVSTIDFTGITDAITKEEALEILRAKKNSRQQREKDLEEGGYPAYITSVGWLGYNDEKIQHLCKQALAEGWRSFKMKVGADVNDDIRRAQVIRNEIGDDCDLMMDANQRWEIPQAVEWMKKLREFHPLWIEEPVSPDDVLGHSRIARELKEFSAIGVATGEHCQNRVVFKQLMQAKAISFCQIDCCRVGGVNENLAIILMAHKFGVPVCPHAGGVGLCEMVQHLSFFDYICVSGSYENRMIEYVDHLHEHFTCPIDVRKGRYHLPQKPGHSSEMHPQSVQDYSFPDGPVWTELKRSGKMDF